VVPLRWSPKKSVLHQTIAAIRAETWEARTPTSSSKAVVRFSTDGQEPLGLPSSDRRRLEAVISESYQGLGMI
jgi:hypothetical protein